MDAVDQYKLLKVGYTIIRERDYDNKLPGKQYYIVAKGSGGHDWYHYEGPFASKAARSRRKKELKESENIVED